jgi:hypothetical protein
MNTIDRLLRACATGVGCRAVINMKVLNAKRNWVSLQPSN